ncbi:hypothetical protein [Curtobacterium sp. MCPF17_051]|uniref:hypothetical protein n=1 Tax=Curtobacterium sp. MCPF17_051 TaxID=2175640 RepID=UPI000DA7478B|nr:hypothetical protein [Curtobacterium sp. MCPF17_051]PZF29114.1 hypothetical protein DEJ35_11220 [Curtobacterium sp. MCPF17_051]
MDISAIVAAVVSSTVISAAVTGLITWRVQTNALKQAKLTETSRLFIELMALGHGRAITDRKDPIGQSEILGAVEMVAAVGLEYKPLRDAAMSYLDGHIISYGSAEVIEVAKRSRARFGHKGS